MRSTARALLKLPCNSKLFPRSPPNANDTHFRLRALSSSSITTTDNGKEPKPRKDSQILEQFRLRKLKGSSKTPPTQESDPNPKREVGVLGFKELGLSRGLSEAMAHLGFSSPSEIQSVGIPAILDGKNVVLCSHSHSVDAFTYLVPLIQNLRGNAKLSREKPKGPRAIVLCTTQEHAEECFQAAKFILEHSKSKNAMENDSIGLLATTPDEVLQFIEEGNVTLNEIKYLVFDEVDDMFDNGLGPDIKKILSPLKELVSKPNHQGLQTILTTSMMMKVLHKDLSSLVENLEQSHAGQVAAVLLEIDQTEAFCLLESPEALKQKVVELIDSLN
ncbi:DEAD-box ATP-dependent RNA helicase 39-like [Humulus lupulus]|uniref:DEAD-box ATP-dependent RNA helicase 39-like n=1 Tax=Humulus lupulus TaxID=3486 RepID=UPI002B404401|nr:DEAD-box ATP-dependent RNA helicase 39-like [Humulus lupulus]